MTLVISFQNKDFVAIAADRMLSIRGKPVALDKLKLVFFYSDMVFGYSGYGRMLDSKNQPQYTDIWLAHVLASIRERSIGKAVEVIAAESGASVCKASAMNLGFPKEFHCIVGVGWHRPIDNVGLVPVTYQIANFSRDETGRRILNDPFYEF